MAWKKSSFIAKGGCHSCKSKVCNEDDRIGDPTIIKEIISEVDTDNVSKIGRAWSWERV